MLSSSFYPSQSSLIEKPFSPVGAMIAWINSERSGCSARVSITTRSTSRSTIFTFPREIRWRLTLTSIWPGLRFCPMGILRLLWSVTQTPTWNGAPSGSSIKSLSQLSSNSSRILRKTARTSEVVNSKRCISKTKRTTSGLKKVSRHIKKSTKGDETELWWYLLF